MLSSHNYGENAVNKSDLIESLSLELDMQDKHAEEAVKEILQLMVNTLSADGRIELRGFGSMCLHHRSPRTARNPKTGELVEVTAKAVPYFKPGKALREAVNDGIDL